MWLLVLLTKGGTGKCVLGYVVWGLESGPGWEAGVDRERARRVISPHCLGRGENGQGSSHVLRTRHCSKHFTHSDSPVLHNL